MADSEEAMEVCVGPQGRIVIPAAMRHALGFAPGTRLLLRCEGGALVLESREHLRERIQAGFDRVPDGISLADALIEERRAEAVRESREGPAEQAR